MAKNRKFPFGYMKQNGEITTNPKEVLAVVTIFRSYLNGESLVDIAKAMEVPYNEGVAWNKNMVKRIIENEKYLGMDKYPQLIDEDTFHRANAKKEKKALSLCVISEELQQVRSLTFCKECGHRLFRRGGNTRSEKWDCRNQRWKPKCPLIGADGNIFNLLGIASRTLRENGMREQAKEMQSRVTASGSYSEAMNILGEYVEICSAEEMDEESDEGMSMM